MAKVVFTSPVDMGAINLADWFGAEADISAQTGTSMTFSTEDETVVVGGTGFNYFFGVPMSGTVNNFSATGVVNAEVTKLNVEIVDVLSALESDTPAEEMIDLFFGGNDAFFGSSGTDVLFGFGGRDKIKGGGGADLIVGGTGRDVMTGGRGSDTFRFEAGDSSNGNPDRITDLDNKDWLDFSDLDIAKRDITVTYDEGSDITTFAIDYKGNANPDMTILANGDHTDFGHFIVG